MNLTEPILRFARTQPDTVAIVDGEREISYRELRELVTRSAAHMATLGLKSGATAGICLRDGWQHVIVLLALARLGVCFVQIDARSRAAEKSRIVDAIGFEIALVEPNGAAFPNCGTQIIDEDWWKTVSATEPQSEIARDWNNPFIILSSSGTTGLPKLAVATHLEFYCRLVAHGEVIPAGPHRYLSATSMSFSSGRSALLFHLLRGDTCVFLPIIANAEAFAEACLREKISSAFVTPAITRRLLQVAEPQRQMFPDIAALVSTGAPLFPDEKREILVKLTGNFNEVYGATGVGKISALRPADILHRPDSVGRALTLIDVEIVDEAGRPCADGELGVFRCRGPTLARPWDKNATEAANEFRDGWHYPGEIASFDSEGYIFLRGRTSEVIFRGTAKIFPSEVEAVLREHDGVIEAAVLAREDDRQQEMIAFVVCKPDITSGDLLAHCRTRLTAYKVPAQIRLVSKLPRTLAGKLDKQALFLEERQ